MSKVELSQKKSDTKTESFWLKVSTTKGEEEHEFRRSRSESEPKRMLPSPRLGKNKKDKTLTSSPSQPLSPAPDSQTSLFPPYLGPAKTTKRQKRRSSSEFEHSPEKEEKEKKKEKKKDKKKRRDIPDPKPKLHTISAPTFEKMEKTPENDSSTPSSSSSTPSSSSSASSSAPSSSSSTDPPHDPVKTRLGAQSQPVFRQQRQPSPPPSSATSSSTPPHPSEHRSASPHSSPKREGKGEGEEAPKQAPASPGPSATRSTSAFFSGEGESSASSASTSTLTNSILEGDLKMSVKEHIESDYDLGDMLGSGAFAIVYKGVNKESGEEVAVKKIKKNIVKESEIKNLRLEVKIMTELNHPGIIRLIDVYEEEESLFIITELMEGGELLDRLSERKTFCEEDAIRLVRNILEAIRYLHDLKIAHRDLKPENLLLKSKDNDTDVRLADFGISRFFDEGFMKTTCGTPAYTAPEVLESSNYTMAVDLWSIGIITYLLLSGKTPFQANSMPRMFMKIMEADFDFPEEDWANVSESAKHFISQLLRKNPLKRMPAAEALKHRWLTEKGGKRTEQNLSTLASLKSMGARKRGISQG